MHYFSWCKTAIYLSFCCFCFVCFCSSSSRWSVVLRLYDAYKRPTPLLFCITFLVLFSAYLPAQFFSFLFVCLFLGRLLHTVAAVFWLESSLSAELIDTHITQSETQKRARAKTWPHVGAFSEFKSVFCCQGRPGLPLRVTECLNARRSVFWMLYKLKRAPGYIHLSRTRTRKAWSFGRGG